ncbi:hypothetical protein AZE42_12478 [Rhizopogon vesiculosus]|uniref:Uncharacterized protein n=1 Tax=Rhizopogon vesiculosus TaxID=180088 RepID=A0A1J8QEA6_9AGAM|nr:hypothetical protein AZE42_12478 [Rhizopogon vesiculosus]
MPSTILIAELCGVT